MEYLGRGDIITVGSDRFVALRGVSTDGSPDSLQSKSFRRLDKDEIPPEHHECGRGFFSWLALLFGARR